ncbi:hypothetical protein F4778DRAFT_113607 [Xylariomycetidae sp. FL2044]|nr:hypothetical protein F4778DRAFT_113607 [Xylariomycetidae sp. FL2044]
MRPPFVKIPNFHSLYLAAGLVSGHPASCAWPAFARPPPPLRYSLSPFKPFKPFKPSKPSRPVTVAQLWLFLSFPSLFPSFFFPSIGPFEKMERRIEGSHDQKSRPNIPWHPIAPISSLFCPVSEVCIVSESSDLGMLTYLVVRYSNYSTATHVGRPSPFFFLFLFFLHFYPRQIRVTGPVAADR